jgi:hypothetical protein
MIRLLFLLALTAHAVVAFIPSTKTTRTFGAITRLSVADSFEGIDLEKLLGSKKFKKTMKKLQRNAHKRSSQNSDETSSKVTGKIHLATSSENSSENASVPQGLKLLIWYVSRFVVKLEPLTVGLVKQMLVYAHPGLIHCPNSYISIRCCLCQSVAPRLPEREHNVPSSRRRSALFI